MTYPEPPQSMYIAAPGDMGLSPDSFQPYQDMRTSHPSHESYPPTSIAYDHTGAPIFADPSYLYSSAARSPPSMYQDDGPASNISTTSATSSNMGSPLSHHDQISSAAAEWPQHGLGVSPGIVDQPEYFNGPEYSFQPMAEAYPQQFEYSNNGKPPGFVDPSLIHPENIPSPYDYPPPNGTYPGSPGLPSQSPHLRTESMSPMVNGYPYPAFPVVNQGRQPSLGPYTPSYPSSDDAKEKQRCPHADCGKTFKDLKAHMLTHQNERPEKCPITSCDYHIKGFARKYDKNRHTLTHYKGNMVCGFCPGSGSSTEKSFNRADVFKRHLTAVHGVEQTPPNSRRKAAGGVASTKKLTSYAPDATGRCSTCSQTFSNAQDFYEHLDDCVLRIVQQEDPAEAVNASNLATVENDKDVHATLERNNLPTTAIASGTDEVEEQEDDDDDEEMADEEDDAADEDYKNGRGNVSPTKKKGNPANGVHKTAGMTRSRGGIPLVGKGRGRKNKREYPTSWGYDPSQMTMRKRVLTVFDGQRRLTKDQMMLSNEHEVRVKLPDGQNYVTDLDVQTMKRAQGFLDATDEEKATWMADDPTAEQFQQMAAFSKHQ